MNVIHRYFVARSGPFHAAMSAAKDINPAIQEEVRFAVALAPQLKGVYLRMDSFGPVVAGFSLNDGTTLPPGLRFDKRRIAVPYKSKLVSAPFRLALAAIRRAMNSQFAAMQTAIAIASGEEKPIEVVTSNAVYISAAGFVDGVALFKTPVRDGWQPPEVDGLEEVTEYEFECVNAGQEAAA